MPPIRQKFWPKMTFWVPLRQNYTFVTPITFRRQTTFIIKIKGQMSTISEKSQKSRKNWQKLRFFEKFWLLWLSTSLRAITLLPVPDRTAQQKSWKNFKKMRAGMTILKKSAFDPPTCNISSHKHIWEIWPIGLIIFSPFRGRMQSLIKSYRRVFEIVKVFAPWILS